MLAEVSAYIAGYGYLAIFLLIFFQEIGIPIPVPNELVLMFSGYLVFTGALFLPFVLITVFTADFAAANLVYCTFYFFGAYILSHKPRWLPVSESVIAKQSVKISNGGKWTIFAGRVTPFLKGYTSVITGLLQIKPGVFLPIAILSGVIWTLGYVIAGSLLGPYWSIVAGKAGNIKHTLILILLVILLIVIGRYFLTGNFFKQKFNRTKKLMDRDNQH